jgi:hypothetical protein
MTFQISRKPKTLKTILFNLLIFTGLAATCQAQESPAPQPKFWFGASGAANLNFYTGTTQTLNTETSVPSAFHDGFGVGAYASLLFEYRPNPMWGGMLNLAYDNRSATFTGVVEPCNCPETLHSKISYLAIEPSLRFAPMSSGLYLFIGPVFSINTGKSFDYTQQEQPIIAGEFSDMQGFQLSGQVGAGFDIPLMKTTNPMQVNLSPFISYHPYFGQSPRTVESMSLTTIRIGAALKFGKVSVKPKEVK